MPLTKATLIEAEESAKSFFCESSSARKKVTI